jgi:hypothetical protein
MDNRNSVDNRKTVNNTDQSNPNDLVCWVKLYHNVPSDVPGASTGTMKTLRDMMVDVFSIVPVPATIRELCSEVKAKCGPFLNHVEAFELEVYESMLPESNVHTLRRTTTPPLLGSAQVPLSTTIVEPLVVVVPDIAAVASPAAADQEFLADFVALAASLRQILALGKRSRGHSVFLSNGTVIPLTVHSVLDRAEEFVKSIMADLRDIPGHDGMQFMRVRNLETGRLQNIVLQESTQAF